MYERVETLAEEADHAPPGKQRDAAITRYLDALNAITKARTTHQKQTAQRAAKQAPPTRLRPRLSRLPGRAGEHAWKISA
ncbi:hypothetical protein ACFPPE_18180 [Agromyces tardus]|uniref:hypothetical protein n=1 Tax=Agromyces tardus TaxID=2583849 RepID=UPI003613F264